MFGPECSWVVDPPPAINTTYSLIARCLDDPTRDDFSLVTVRVQRRPDFNPALVTAWDKTNCNLGVQLNWGEVVFYGPGGTGVYNVYRSPNSCLAGL